MSAVNNCSIHSPSKACKLKKSPHAPKRFKSAFIIFSMSKHKEVRAQMGAEGCSARATKVAKVVAEAWKSLSAEERAKWDAMAHQDKIRFETEKSRYKGPWRVPIMTKRSQVKDPLAPKRPMSSFLAFSNKRRSHVKRLNPHLGNADLSRTLSAMWKAASPELRQKYIKQEFTQRQAYKAEMAEWRKAKEALVKQKEQQDAATWTADDRLVPCSDTNRLDGSPKLPEVPDGLFSFHNDYDYAPQQQPTISTLQRTWLLPNPRLSSVEECGRNYYAGFGLPSLLPYWNEKVHLDATAVGFGGRLAAFAPAISESQYPWNSHNVHVGPTLRRLHTSQGLYM